MFSETRAIHVITARQSRRQGDHMKAFSINADNDITVHASRKAARETEDGVFTTQEQLGELIGKDGKRLVEIWNSLTGVTSVKKFTSAKVGIARIWEAIQGLGDSVDSAPDTAETEASQKPDVAPEEAPASKKATRAKKAPTSAAAANGARQGSKTATVLELLKRKGGVTAQELMDATGWQPHSVRGFISGTVGKKMGLTVASTKSESGERTYSV
jgi:hypothetical protein